MSLITSNLLKKAQELIPAQSIVLYAWTGTTNNSAGVDVPAYASPVTLTDADVQAVPRTMYEALGLDLQKNYIMVYTSTALRDVNRNQSCDQITWGGRKFDVESNTDWMVRDGWHNSLCVDVGAAS